MTMSLDATGELCWYGCGNPATTRLKNGKLICSEYSTQCPINEAQNQKSSVEHYKLHGTCYTFSADDRHRGTTSRAKKYISTTPFEQLGYKCRKRVIMEDQNGACAICSLTNWYGLPISFEIDHIDGNSKNNNRSNLRMLCPNCHSQTPTWRGRNVSRVHSVVISDLELIMALKTTKNIRQALFSVNLAAKGGNYKRAKKLLATL